MIQWEAIYWQQFLLEDRSWTSCSIGCLINDFDDNDVGFTCCMSSFSKSTFLHNLPTHILLMLSISSRTWILSNSLEKDWHPLVTHVVPRELATKRFAVTFQWFDYLNKHLCYDLLISMHWELELEQLQVKENVIFSCDDILLYSFPTKILELKNGVRTSESIISTMNADRYSILLLWQTKKYGLFLCFMFLAVKSSETNNDYLM